MDGGGAVQTSGSSNRAWKMTLMGPFFDPIQKPENRWIDRFNPCICRLGRVAAHEDRADRKDPRWQFSPPLNGGNSCPQTSVATASSPSPLPWHSVTPFFHPQHPASKLQVRMAKHAAAAAPGMGGGALHGRRPPAHRGEQDRPCGRASPS
jgi:hypothetical protein